MPLKQICSLRQSAQNHDGTSNMNTPVRVRFAPSPTGHLHIGSLRSALFNWLFAKHTGGTFLLRIEDTDVERSRSEYLESILGAFDWLDIHSDEPLIIQSERIIEYNKIANMLLQNKRAYRCYCTPDELAKRATAQHTGDQEIYFRYDGKCRFLKETREGQPFAIRFALPEELEQITFEDLIRGPITINRDQLDDFIIVRSDGMPMYNFAVVVDDALMRISHIIRGEEHIANTPKQIVLYQACNYQIPQFAHIPLILGPSGEKLSKRDGAVSVLEYKASGYTPNALICYLARLGWSHGDQEIFSKDELIEYFTLDAIGKKGSIFDITKLQWVNSHFIKTMTTQEIINKIASDLEISLETSCPQWNLMKIQQAVRLYKDRAHTLRDISGFVEALYHGPKRDVFVSHYTGIVTDKTKEYLEGCMVFLQKQINTDLDKKHIADGLSGIAKQYNVNFMHIAKPMRLALFGAPEGPSIADMIVLLGIQESIVRVNALGNFLTMAR